MWGWISGRRFYLHSFVQLMSIWSTYRCEREEKLCGWLQYYFAVARIIRKLFFKIKNIFCQCLVDMKSVTTTRASLVFDKSTHVHMRMCGDIWVALFMPNVILYTPRKYFKNYPSCTKGKATIWFLL